MSTKKPRKWLVPLPRKWNQYSYEAIPEENTIRILTLFPGEPGSCLTGTLRFANLENKPAYDAVSYVWGSAVRCEKILLDGKSLGLTQSISDALHRLRETYRPARLWVDQVCINQDEIVERSSQVKLMSRIYKRACHVLVWLGPDEQNHAGPAFKKILSLKETFEDDDRSRAFTEDQLERLDDFRDEEWKPLTSLYELPWIFDALVLDEAFVVPVDLEENDVRLSFIYTLDTCRTCGATDPKDKVFARLGHYSAQVLLETVFPFEVDYTKTINEVYTDVAARTLRAYPTLETLNAVQLTDCDFTANGRLPSWVPDWREACQSTHGDRSSFDRSAGDSKISLSIRDISILEIEGLEVDSIRAFSARLEQKNFSPDRVRGLGLGNCESNFIRDLWVNVCQLSSFSLDHEYVNGDSAVLAFCQSLTAGSSILAILKKKKGFYRGVAKEYWLRHGAAYLAEMFQGTGWVSQDIEDAAINGDAFAWVRNAQNTCHNRSFFRTANEHYGIGNHLMEEGDKIVVLFGGKTPYILRPKEDHYYLIGECYVYGLMDGEAIAMMDRGELKPQTFSIH
ncbi:hypothetical protein B2J93_3447 [Marssonina coronariae]|uniref:Heterokaryon incompatibility domain-containing protein n=1 Tax=Diplocarpon coronariae TaxID=2795749 RepID=A0A218Z4B2_9HELO|nr:hypothetical protein B2J93_3447 [Marssonina coronariae]